MLSCTPGRAAAAADRCETAGQVPVSACAVEAIRALWPLTVARPALPGWWLTADTAIFERALGLAKRRIGARLGSSATTREGTPNLLCAYLAMTVLAVLAASTLLGVWWLDGVAALGLAGWAVAEGRRAWAGRSGGCACRPGAQY